MNLQEAIKELNKTEYPTQKTILAFGIRYPALFREVVKELKNSNFEKIKF